MAQLYKCPRCGRYIQDADMVEFSEQDTSFTPGLFGGGIVSTENIYTNICSKCADDIQEEYDEIDQSFAKVLIIVLSVLGIVSVIIWIFSEGSKVDDLFWWLVFVLFASFPLTFFINYSRKKNVVNKYDDDIMRNEWKNAEDEKRFDKTELRVTRSRYKKER